MAEINLGNDTELNVSLGTQTNLSTTVYDINYIPDYVKAEQERRANETIRIANEEERQENEEDRIALYEDLENKLEQDYWRGSTGATPNINATASISGGTGTPGVTVTRTGTDEEPNLSFAFTNLKGDKGDKGDAGAVKFIIVNELPETGADDTIYLLPITPDTTGNNYAEYIYINNQWELLGKIGVQVDLTDYVKNTDYATSSKGGVFIISNTYGTNVINGKLISATKDYTTYVSANDNMFISKGTLENVLNNRIGDIDTALDLINNEVV